MREKINIICGRRRCGSVRQLINFPSKLIPIPPARANELKFIINPCILRLRPGCSKDERDYRHLFLASRARFELINLLKFRICCPSIQIQLTFFTSCLNSTKSRFAVHWYPFTFSWRCVCQMSVPEENETREQLADSFEWTNRLCMGTTNQGVIRNKCFNGIICRFIDR